MLFYIKNFYQKNDLDFTLKNFEQYKNFIEDDRNDWLVFFYYYDYLIEEVKKSYKSKNQKEIIFFTFFDEINWFSKGKNKQKKEIIKNNFQKEKIVLENNQENYIKLNDFLSGFSNYWNSTGEFKNNHLIFFACSSNSWIRSKIFKDTKGLYKRIIRQEIKPFKFEEIVEFFKKNNWFLNKKQVLKYYFIFGGYIKYYIENLNINFSKELENNLEEINNLYSYIEEEYLSMFRGVFSEKKQYKEIVNLLNNSKTLSTKEIFEKINRVTKNLKKKEFSYEYIRKQIQELEEADFINYFQKNNEKIYYINNPLAYFYYFWINEEYNVIGEYKVYKNKFEIKDKFYNWQGTNFEIFVMNNLIKIFEVLKIKQDANIFFNYSLTYKDFFDNNLMTLEDLLHLKKNKIKSLNNEKENEIIKNELFQFEIKLKGFNSIKQLKNEEDFFIKQILPLLNQTIFQIDLLIEESGKNKNRNRNKTLYVFEMKFKNNYVGEKEYSKLKNIKNWLSVFYEKNSPNINEYFINALESKLNITKDNINILDYF